MDSWEDLRKLYLKICDNISSVESCKSRHWFLSQFLSLSVCPRTLRCNAVPPKMFSKNSMKNGQMLRERLKASMFRLLGGEKLTQIHNSSFQKSRCHLEAKFRSHYQRMKRKLLALWKTVYMQES